MSNSASELRVAQIGSSAQNTRNILPFSVDSHVSYWDQHKQQKLHNVHYQQNHPSLQQYASQNEKQPQIPMLQQWPQKQTNINYATPTHPQHLYQNSQLFQQHQSQMTVSNQFHPQLIPSKTHYQSSEPHAQRSLVPNQKGGYKAVIKRNKGKRTMFTTEQLEFLESYFSSKPYVTRKERQVLVETLSLSDKAVKLWFQNRRIRSKKEQEQSFEEEDSGISTGSSPLLPNSSTSSISSTSDADTTPDLDKIILELSKNQSWRNKDQSDIEEILNYPIKPQPQFDSHILSSKLDQIEFRMNQRTDEFGNIHMSEELLAEVMNIVDKFLPQNLDLDELQRNCYEKITETVEIQNENTICEKKYPKKEENITFQTMSENETNVEQTSTKIQANYSKAEIVGVIEDGDIHMMTGLENVGYCYIIDNGVNSGNNTCTVAMYEPISPADSVEEQDIVLNKNISNKNTIPKDKLQEIFDRVFC